MVKVKRTFPAPASLAVEAKKVTGKYDINTVLTHELGHALGVPHCHEAAQDGNCYSGSCSSNVMNRLVDTGEVRVTLTSYDKMMYRTQYD